MLFILGLLEVEFFLAGLFFIVGDTFSFDLFRFSIEKN